MNDEATEEHAMSRRINTPQPTDRDLIGRARTLTPGEVPPAATPVATEAKPEIRKMGFKLSSMALD